MIETGMNGGADMNSSETTGTTTLAEAVVDTLQSYGVRRIFGVPGGGSSLQIIDAAARRGIDFVLTRSEAPAIMMAAVTGELSGRPGAALTTKGPGIANGVNGLAYASLDRAPMVVLADGFDPAGLAYQSHQVFDQTALVAPLTKAQSRLTGHNPTGEMADLLDIAMTHPRGPVYCEFTAARGKKAVEPGGPGNRPHVAVAQPDPEALEKACALLAARRRPIIVAGLQVVRDPAWRDALDRLAGHLGCPVLPTYKAKGCLPDSDPRVMGLYVGGAGEEEILKASDLIILFGADPVEYALQPWRYPDHPVVDLSLHEYERHYMTPEASVVGALDASADALIRAGSVSAWDAQEMAQLREDLRQRLMVHGSGEITPQHVIDAAVAAAPENARICVDAGAHMLPTMAFWQAREPNDVLISNGLATMAFALPAAIAAALHDPQRPVIAFTGDGGLAMCLGELATAAQHGCNITVVVFNDSALSMIGVKQASTGYEPLGVAFSETDFATTARGMGVFGVGCTRREDLEAAMREAFAHPGPALVDVRVDPSGYHDQVKRLRG